MRSASRDYHCLLLVVLAYVSLAPSTQGLKVDVGKHKNVLNVNPKALTKNAPLPPAVKNVAAEAEKNLDLSLGLFGKETSEQKKHEEEETLDTDAFEDKTQKAMFAYDDGMYGDAMEGDVYGDPVDLEPAYVEPGYDDLAPEDMYDIYDGPVPEDIPPAEVYDIYDQGSPILMEMDDMGSPQGFDAEMYDIYDQGSPVMEVGLYDDDAGVPDVGAPEVEYYEPALPTPEEIEEVVYYYYYPPDKQGFGEATEYEDYYYYGGAGGGGGKGGQGGEGAEYLDGSTNNLENKTVKSKGKKLYRRKNNSSKTDVTDVAQVNDATNDMNQYDDPEYAYEDENNINDNGVTEKAYEDVNYVTENGVTNEKAYQDENYVTGNDVTDENEYVDEEHEPDSNENDDDISGTESSTITLYILVLLQILWTILLLREIRNCIYVIIAERKAKNSNYTVLKV